jgi:putative ubiquitin-RnfH superfamily antitoxin RatB of RatAB toxin-antitoxin module
MIRITLVHSPEPRVVHELPMELPEGTPLGQALALSGWLERFPDLNDPATVTGLWGRKAARATVLQAGDRVEIYRGLRVDPKVARRERFVGQGARTAGLFAQRRPNSKSGY